MRKINALLVIFVIALAVSHAVSILFYYLGILGHTFNYGAITGILTIVMLLHMLISIFLVARDIKTQQGMKKYDSMLMETNLQTITGVLMVLTTVGHIIVFSQEYSVFTLWSKWFIIRLVVDFILTTSILVHMSISIPRVAVSFGWVTGNKGYEKVCKVSKWSMTLLWIVYAVCTVVFYILE